jgi:hypothetical protein
MRGLPKACPFLDSSNGAAGLFIPLPTTNASITNIPSPAQTRPPIGRMAAAGYITNYQPRAEDGQHRETRGYEQRVKRFVPEVW